MILSTAGRIGNAVLHGVLRMNPLLLEFANGHAFFAGMVLAAVGSLLGIWRCSGWRAHLPRLAVVLGIVLVVSSATPLPRGVLAGWLVAVLAAVGTGGRAAMPRLRKAAAVLAVLGSVGLALFELPYHLPPRIELAPGQSIYVVGDSLSAGTGSGERPWPAVLAEEYGLRVTNLAAAGATAGRALQQVEGIEEEAAVVLVHIGGNDLLAGRENAVFEDHLDRLLGALRRRQARIVLFELPLIPFHNDFGRRQRAVAARYQVPLIPKRYTTRPLGTRGGTLDGLHLSQRGHDVMARGVAELLRAE